MAFGFLGWLKDRTKKVLLFQVDDITKSTLQFKIKNYVKPGSTILSDCWKGYNSLNEQGFYHQTVNHSRFFKIMKLEYIQILLRVLGLH